LTPAYVPKFFVVMPDGLPLLPNGKPNLSELKKLATQHAEEEGDVVMDSLGQMKKMSSWAIFENNVTHRCYAYWMIGVLTDHYNRCASDYDQAGKFLEFCTPLAQDTVRPWSEILVRSFGNDQDMFGFIMLGAYQDSRPAKQGQKSRVKFGLKDLFIFLIYCAMAVPFGPLMYYIFRDWAWPKSTHLRDLQGHWDVEYMKYHSYQSDHRWYLLMVLQARLYLQLGEWICDLVAPRAPAWTHGLAQTLVFAIPVVALDTEAGNLCVESNSDAMIWFGSLIFRNFGSGCPVYVRWFQIYGLYYVMSYHFLRSAVDKFKKFLPVGATWSALALTISMCLGVAQAMWHYPNYALEDGSGMKWVWWEFFVDMAQPMLFALGMTYLPLNMAWWGNTTLGCYVFHFYFRDTFTTMFLHMGRAFNFDATGLLLPLCIIGICGAFTTICGPFGHYLLLSPTLVYARFKKNQKVRNAASPLKKEAA